MVGAQDFYELLRVDKGAETSQIKKAYRKLSLEYHPDKNPGDEEAAEKFMRINRAYEVLSDENKRQIYDQQGEEEVERFERGGDNRRKGPNNKVTLQASLEDLYNGAETTFTVNRNVYCHECKGSGAEGGKKKTCPTCKGTGQVTQNVNMGMMQMQMQQPCNRCGGKGKTNEKNCKHCRGKRVVNEGKSIRIEVEKGMKNGDTIIFERQGEQVPDMIQGDVVFTVKQEQHSLFRRVGNNLYMNMDISLEEALLGFEKKFNHLDGHQVTVKSDGVSVIQPFSWQILAEEGMPIRGSQEFGELHIKFIVNFPRSLNAKQKELVNLIFPEDSSSFKVTEEEL